MNIGMWILIIVGGAVGVLSTLYCILSLPVIIVWKCFRSIKYKISLFD